MKAKVGRGPIRIERVGRERWRGVRWVWIIQINILTKVRTRRMYAEAQQHSA